MYLVRISTLSDRFIISSKRNCSQKIHFVEKFETLIKRPPPHRSKGFSRFFLHNFDVTRAFVRHCIIKFSGFKTK